MDGYLTTGHIAQLLGVTVETVRHWVRQGKLPSLSLGRAGYRIRQEDFDRFVQERSNFLRQPTKGITEPSVLSAMPGSGENVRDESLRRVIAIDTVGFIFFKPDGSITDCNDAFLRMSGYTREDLLHGLVRWDTMTPPEWIPHSLRAIQEFETMGHTTPYEKEYIRKNGSRWWALFSATRVNEEEGVEIIIDITERKHRQLNAVFLADLTEAISRLSSQEEILQVAGERIARYFSVSHLTFAQVDEAADESLVLYDVHEQNVVHVVDRPRISDYVSKDFLQEMKAGHVIVVNDIAVDPRSASAVAFASFDVRAYILAPYVSEQQVDFVIALLRGEPYQWRSDEIDLMRELAARIYPQLERVRAEQALQESRAEIERQRRFFEATLANLSGMVFVWNRKKHYVYANPALERLWGVQPGGVVGKTTADLGDLGYSATFSEHIIRQIEQVFETGEEVRDEAAYTSPTGISGYYEYVFSPIIGEDGIVEFVAGMSQDITERKRLEQALRDSERRVQAERQRLYDLFMQAPAAIMVTKGPNHIYELLNPLAVQFLGTHRQYIGKPGREAVPEAVEQGFFDLLDAVYQTGKPFIGNEIPAQFVSKADGTMVQMYFNFVYQPSYDSSGEIDGVLAYVNNVTESVLSRKRVEESEERFRALANSVPQLAWSARADGAIDFFNERVHEYAKMTRDEEGIYAWQEIVHPDDLESVIRSWEHAKQTGTLFEHEQRLHMNDGTYRWHLVRGLPTYGTDGTVLRWYGTKTDIEQLKQLEQQRSTFLGVVSHELRTPVTSAKGYAEVLESRFHKAGDEKSALLLTKLSTQMDKLTLLISDLLDVTRLEAGKLQFHEAYFTFDDLVADILEEVQRTTSTHTIQRQGTTNATVYGDRDRIGQVLTNLLTNAIKYSPNATTVVVTSSCTEQEVTLCVQDSGIGIAKDKLPHVFERFFRETGAREETFPGLGLGLYVASEIIQRQGGKIWAESEKGRCSTFCFALPLVTSPAHEPL